MYYLRIANQPQHYLNKTINDENTNEGTRNAGINTQVLGQPQYQRFAEYFKKNQEILSNDWIYNKSSSIISADEKIREKSFNQIFKTRAQGQLQSLYVAGKLFNAFNENLFLRSIYEQLK
ncbi:MAG TPA: hypothetical protein VFI29_08650 [Hanamia sp.]|nr:hypothetical protein [Hanamia sp.]